MTRTTAPRLGRADYVGHRGYLLTICTFQRAPILESADLVESLLIQFQQCASAHRFANHAYSFLPDHVHFVIEGQNPDSDCYEMIRLWKSRTAFGFKRVAKRRLWQRSFYDRVARDYDELTALARYVIDNPTRATLPPERCRYPFVGSATTTIEKILRRELPRKEFSKSAV